MAALNLNLTNKGGTHYKTQNIKNIRPQNHKRNAIKLALGYTKTVFSQGSALDPSRGVHDAHPYTIVG